MFAAPTSQTQHTTPTPTPRSSGGFSAIFKRPPYQDAAVRAYLSRCYLFTYCFYPPRLTDECFLLEVLLLTRDARLTHSSIYLLYLRRTPDRRARRLKPTTMPTSAPACLPACLPPQQGGDAIVPGRQGGVRAAGRARRHVRARAAPADDVRGARARLPRHLRYVSCLTCT